MMSDAATIAARINERLDRMNAGSLRFFGDSFGRPMDNQHRVTGADNEGDLLRVFFDQGEVLSVWGPSGAEISTGTFVILDARRVRWEWDYYGAAQGGRSCMDYRRVDSGIEVTTDHGETYNANPDAYAVDMY